MADAPNNDIQALIDAFNKATPDPNALPSGGAVFVSGKVYPGGIGKVEPVPMPNISHPPSGNDRGMIPVSAKGDISLDWLREHLPEVSDLNVLGRIEEEIQHQYVANTPKGDPSLMVMRLHPGLTAEQLDAIFQKHGLSLPPERINELLGNVNDQLGAFSFSGLPSQGPAAGGTPLEDLLKEPDPNAGLLLKGGNLIIPNDGEPVGRNPTIIARPAYPDDLFGIDARPFTPNMAPDIPTVLADKRDRGMMKLPDKIEPYVEQRHPQLPDMLEPAEPNNPLARLAQEHRIPAGISTDGVSRISGDMNEIQVASGGKFPGSGGRERV